jgi:hypothetical protein
MLKIPLTLFLFTLLLTSDSFRLFAQDSYADSVVSYVSGTGISPSYTNSSAALGAPDFSATITAPAYGNTNILGVGDGGELTVAFNTPITNDPSGHADGMDFTIFGNQFFTLSGTNISGIYDHPGLTVWVSQDEVNFYQLVAPDGLPHGADDLYPTEGGENPFLPVNPSLSLTNFVGQSVPEALSLYNGSAGGASYSISWAENSNGAAVDLSSISYIMVEGTSGYGYVDAISRVEDVPEPSENALLLTGAGALIFYRTRRRASKNVKGGFCDGKVPAACKHTRPCNTGVIGKMLFVLTLVGSFCPAGMLRADVTTGVPVLITVGDTNDPYVSYLVIDDTSLGNSAFEYAWYYTSTTEEGTTNPLTGTDLLNAVIAGTTNTPEALTPIYDPEYTNFVTGFQIGDQTSTIATLEDPTATAYWAYWINGGSQTTSYPPIITVTPTSWIVAPDTSLYRTLTNGSWDGWTLDPVDEYGDYIGAAPLSAAAIPEPATSSFLILSLITLLVIVRWKPSIHASKL